VWGGGVGGGGQAPARVPPVPLSYDRDEGCWWWPLLDFEVDNLFAVGSPIAMFLTVRGDFLLPSWPHVFSYRMRSHIECVLI